MMRYMIWGMMIQALISGALAYAGWITLRPGQQILTGFFYLLTLALWWVVDHHRKTKEQEPV